MSTIIYLIPNYESNEKKFVNRLFDGILGLGGFIGNNTIINEYIQNMLTYKMVDQGIIKNNIFSLYINNSNTNYGDLNMHGGEIIFGEIRKTKYKGSIKCYNIYNDHDIYYFWSLKLNNITINESLPVNDKVLLDSGTSGIVLDKEKCDKIHNQIGGSYNNISNSYIFKDDKKLKNISIYLNDDEFILNPKDYIYVLNNTIYSKFIVNNNKNTILGLPFLQKYYSIYNFDNKTRNYLNIKIKFKKLKL